VTALTLPGLDSGPWQVRNSSDPAANALADRHYNRQRRGSGQVGPPGRKLVFVTPCERAVWVTHWPYADLALDGMDSWRCSIFRNEGAGLSSDDYGSSVGREASGQVLWASASTGVCARCALIGVGVTVGMAQLGRSCGWGGGGDVSCTRINRSYAGCYPLYPLYPFTPLYPPREGELPDSPTESAATCTCRPCRPPSVRALTSHGRGLAEVAVA
jgi:hypothetical protein